jgi:pimeloyl-ACP methyl ester carboxylesterase
LIVYLFLAVAVLAGIGVAYQSAGVRRDRKRYPPPGSVLEVAGSRLHVRSSGEGTPAVVLEAGIAASSLSWSLVQPEVASFTRVVSYDRAGFAWSGPCIRPRTEQQIITELRAVVCGAGVTAPYVFVGHSFGALIGILLANVYREDVAGLVLVDPPLVSEWAEPTEARLRMLAAGVALSRRGALLSRLGIVRAALSLLASGSQALPKLVNRASSGRGASVTERLIGEVRKLPPELWPAIRSHWSRPECFQSMAEHLSSLPKIASDAARVVSLGDLPLVVVTGAHLTPEQCNEHEKLAQLSTQGRHVVARSGGHWVHLDDPDTVVRAIREVVEGVGAT